MKDGEARIWASRPAWVYLLMFAAAIAVFAPICSHPFLSWDDDHTIEKNPLLQHPSVTNALHYWREPFMDLYVPVTYAVWSVLAGISKLVAGASPDARVFHAASVLLHALNSALVLWLLWRLLHRPWPAAAGALLFALHPVQVETVAWTSGMKDLLCATFCLVALTQYLLSIAPEISATRRRIHYAFALAAMLLGMLSKPTAMVTPLLLLIIDLLIIGRSWGQVAGSVWPFFALAIPCVVWTKLCQPQDSLKPGPLWHLPLIAADAIAFYLYKIALPIDLTFDYGRNPTAVLQNGWLYWTWIVPVTVGAALWYFRKTATPLIASSLLLIAGVAPVLGLVPFDYQLISTVTDHYLYLAMLGPALAACWAVSRWNTRIMVPTAVVVLGFLGVRSAAQQSCWRDSETMFVHAIEINPESWMSFFKLGYLSQLEGQRLIDLGNAKSSRHEDPTSDRQAATERFAIAAEMYEQAIRLNPNSVISYHNYASTLMFFRRYADAAAALRQVMARRELLRPSDRLKYNDDADLLGQCLFNLGQYASSVRAFDAARHMSPAPVGAEEHFQRAAAAQKISVTDTR
jgi:tetratricopeptide (TPR) repeat protein